MGRKRRSFSPAFKAKVALAATKGDRTLAELACQYRVYPGKKRGFAYQPRVDRVAIYPEIEGQQHPNPEGVAAGSAPGWRGARPANLSRGVTTPHSVSSAGYHAGLATKMPIIGHETW